MQVSTKLVAGFFLTAITQFAQAQDAPTNSTSNSIPSNLPTPWMYEGCFTDSPQDRTLTNSFYRSNDSMTPESCIDFCNEEENKINDTPYPYVALSYGSECFCGYTLASTSTRVSNDSECSFPCSGDSSQPCGGNDRVTLLSSNTPAPVLANISGWTIEGCYNDTPTARILTDFSLSAENMTVQICTKLCRDRKKNIAGVEWGRECYCDNEIRGNSASLGENLCNYPCVANTSEFCGGNGRVNIYRYSAASRYVVGWGIWIGMVGGWLVWMV